MTGPDGSRSGGWWRIVAVDEPRSFTFDDGFADADLTPAEDMPVAANDYVFTAVDGRTRAVFTSTFDSAEAMQQVLDMGVEEGATLAINQIDGFLAAA